MGEGPRLNWHGRGGESPRAIGPRHRGGGSL